MNRQQILKLTQCAILSTIIIVMTFVPYLGYIQTPYLALTTIQIPVAIGAILLGPMYGIVLGAVWGVTCLLNAPLMGPMAVPFLNPLVSVVPRVAVGLVAALIYLGLRKVLKPRFPLFALTGLCTSLLNTIFVLGMLTWTKGGGFIDSALLSSLLTYAISINGIVEMSACFLLVGAIGQALLRAKVVRGAKSEEKQQDSALTSEKM